jgi:AraC family transcriptional regulator, regulatory protein of adaptative response / DNA-3-methyladenine glycosylase II
VFDVGADSEMIARQLGRDPVLARLITRKPGLRSPGGWDAFEVAVRAILGQQISVEAARQLAGKLVRLCGKALPEIADRNLIYAFPSAQCLARADLNALGMPEARKSALKALAEAAVSQPKLFEPAGSGEDTVARLSSIKGIGELTPQYIAMRG